MPPAFAATAPRFAVSQFNHSSRPNWLRRICQAGFSISFPMTPVDRFRRLANLSAVPPGADADKNNFLGASNVFRRDESHERQAHAESAVRHATSSSPRWGFCRPQIHAAPSHRSAVRIAQWLGRCCLARRQRLARIRGCIDIGLFQLAQTLFFFLLLFG
jgi:hypothetical protein